MARSVGVPAREIFGIRMARESDITDAFHCRGEFYLPGYGWVPVDPSDVRKFMLNNGLELDNPGTVRIRDYYFGAQTETYVDFYSGRDVILVPKQESGPLNYLMYPYAEIDGKPLDWFAQTDLKYTVTFKGI
jgi:transglutaminase-like putative cysteine protease